MELFFRLFRHSQQRRFFVTLCSACPVRDSVVFLSFKRFLVERRRRLKYVAVLGCVPFNQSKKSGFYDPKFDFSLHQGLNQSKIAIWTIHLRTWIVQIGISIWFQIFVPFNEAAFRSQELARLAIMMLVQAKVIYTPPLFWFFHRFKVVQCVCLKSSGLRGWGGDIPEFKWQGWSNGEKLKTRQNS